MPTISIDLDALCDAVDAARSKTTDQRWLNALDAGYDWLLQQDTVELDADGSLFVPSASEPGKVYHANGDCQCTAFIGDKACWHRAAARLVKRMREVITGRQRQPETIETDGRCPGRTAALAARCEAARRLAYAEMAELF